MTRPTTFGSTAPASPPVLESPTDRDPLGKYDLGDTIGSFMGSLRRAKPSKHGLTAQVFGENGEDADFISALHLTQYLDATVKVSVWMIKDRDGRLSDPSGKQQPLLTQFIGRVRRPQSSESGQTAQFFGENGPNSDAINKLNETRYLDALVLVELQKAGPGVAPEDITTASPHEELEAAGKNRHTTHETSRLKRHQKRAAQAQTLLQQRGFFRTEHVLQALGPVSAYTEWLCSQPCCHPQAGQGVCLQGPILPLEVTSRLRIYSHVPMCVEHRELWTSEAPPDVGAQGTQAFLSSQAIIFAQRWAQDALRRKLNVPVGFLPSPVLVYSWAADHSLRGYLPAEFSGFMEDN